MTETDSAITPSPIRPVERVAVVSVHGCPDAPLGSKDAGGMNVYIRKVAEELSDRGVFVDVFSRNHDANVPPTVQLAERARVVHVNAGDPSDDKAELSRNLPAFVDAVLDYTGDHGLIYDIVHSHYWLSGMATTLLARRWGVPHVATFHTLAEVKKRARAGEDEPEERSVGEVMVVRAADAIVAFSRHERDALVRFYDASADKVEVIPCGVDVDLFRPVERDEARQKLGLGDGGVVLFVGRLEPLKGVDILLRAVAQLELADTTRTLIVGGDLQADAEAARLTALCGELGIAERVSFLGRMVQHELPLYYSAADVFVLPSHYESFGLVALESMACGTPVIASRVGGLPTIVKDGLNGYLIPSRSPEPFADGLDVLLGNPAIRQAMSEASRETAVSMGWAAVSDNLLNTYQRLLSEASLDAS
ncbi:MAG: glycosyltransferase [Chloroflexota bacterium]|nr:glycosyltransferase [Chloroflexota bacterium]MDE2942231.1 glycosyltransferase [Chloroflexota bacterium]MDE3267698.1 glycosyltransferase [Chloroflexota bacterium]